VKIQTHLTALALFLGTAGFSHATQTIISAGLPTTTNTSGACYLRNVGTRPVTVELKAMINYSSAFIQPSFENCNDAPLAPGKTCVLLLDDLDDGVAFACSAAVSGSARNVRGSVEVRALTPTGPKVVLSERLR
jgi:hypothetical protein